MEDDLIFFKTRMTTSKKIEDNLKKNKKMEDDLKKKNGRRPKTFFEKLK